MGHHHTHIVMSRIRISGTMMPSVLSWILVSLFCIAVVCAAFLYAWRDAEVLCRGVAEGYFGCWPLHHHSIRATHQHIPPRRHTRALHNRRRSLRQQPPHCLAKGRRQGPLHLLRRRLGRTPSLLCTDQLA